MSTEHGSGNSRSSEGKRSDGTLQRLGSKLFESHAVFRHHLGLLRSLERYFARLQHQTTHIMTKLKLLDYHCCYLKLSRFITFLNLWMRWLGFGTWDVFWHLGSVLIPMSSEKLNSFFLLRLNYPLCCSFSVRRKEQISNHKLWVLFFCYDLLFVIAP